MDDVPEECYSQRNDGNNDNANSGWKCFQRQIDLILGKERRTKNKLKNELQSEQLCTYAIHFSHKLT